MFRLPPPLVALATLVAGLSFLAGAPAPKAGNRTADWPEFRGPKHDNISPDKNLLKEWPKDGPKVAWKGEGVGTGFSSVSVAGDKVFTMGDKDKACYVFAIDRSSGKPLWATKVGASSNYGGYAGPRCTPTVDGKLAYVIDPDGDLVCLETEKGVEQWRKNFRKDYGGQMMSGWGYSESPLVDGDRLVFTPGGAKASMVALDKRTGEVVWLSPAKVSAGYSSIVISNAAGVKQYVQLTGGGTIGVKASDGKLLWQYKRLGPNTANAPTPVVLGDQVFTTAGYGKGGALSTLTSGGPTGVTMKEEYYKTDLKNKHGGVTVVGEYAYADSDDSGQPYCAEWKTGDIKWKRGREGKGGGSCAITYADGHLYCRYQNGHVALVPVPADSYTEVSSFQIPNVKRPSWPHPVVIGGRLYLREQDTVWCYDVSAK